MKTVAVTILLALSSPAFAETVPVQCGASYWLGFPGVPDTVADAPLTPTILLPVQWHVVAYEPVPHPNTTPITVVVRDASDTEVPGEVFIPPIDDSNDGFATSYAPRWRPTAPLTAGASYTLTIDVPPADDTPYVDCVYPMIHDTVAFTVRDGERPTSTLEITDLSTADGWEYSTLYSKDCDSLDSPAHCAEHPDVCCAYASAPVLTRGFASLIRATQLGPGGAPYHQLTVELRYDDGATHVVKRTPVTLNEVYSDSTKWSPEAGPLPADGACVVATLTSLLEGDAEVARVERCADPAAHTVLPAPVLECSLEQCETEAGSNPDSAPESAAETSGAETDDTGSSSHSKDDGCSGGSPTGWIALLLAATTTLRSRIRKA